jgi:hypothetical protein
MWWQYQKLIEALPSVPLASIYGVEHLLRIYGEANHHSIGFYVTVILLLCSTITSSIISSVYGKI